MTLYPYPWWDDYYSQGSEYVVSSHGYLLYASVISAPDTGFIASPGLSTRLAPWSLRKLWADRILPCFNFN